MRLRATADAVRVDDNDGRITLVIDTDEGDTLTVDIHGCALDFEANVRSVLRPYALEAEHARVTPQLVTARPVSVEDAIEAGYALDDPKSPGYYDRMVD